MSTTPPDDSPSSSANPYEPPGTSSGPGRSIARGLGAGLGAFAIVIASLVAFVATCVPLSLATNQSVASIGGIVVAVLVGVGLSVLFFRRK